MQQTIPALAATTRNIIFLLRLAMAWVFLYAASHQVFNAEFSVAGFLGQTTTFAWLFKPLTGAVIAPVITFLVAWGHLLIGVSLALGLLTRLGALAGIVAMILYWMAHMDFPYVDGPLNFLLDFHIVYALVLALLISTRAGHYLGMDSWLLARDGTQRSGFLSWAAG